MEKEEKRKKEKSQKEKNFKKKSSRKEWKIEEKYIIDLKPHHFLEKKTLIQKFVEKIFRKPIRITRNRVEDIIEKNPNALIILSKNTKKHATNSLINVLNNHPGQIIENPNIEELELKRIKIQEGIKIVIGLGGGRIMDAAKYISKIHNLPLIKIPSILSTTSWLNSGIAIRKNNQIFFAGSKNAKLILIDIDLLLKAPSKLHLAGLVDVMVGITALIDWKLDNMKNGTKYPEKKALVMIDWINNIMKNREYFSQKNFSEQSIIDLINVMIEAMGLCGYMLSGRPLEGSEHFHYYYSEEKLNKPLLHGEMLAYNIPLVMELQSKFTDLYLDIKTVLDFFSDIGFTASLIENDLQLPANFWKDSLNEMKSFVSKRKLAFSIWNLIDNYNN